MPYQKPARGWSNPETPAPSRLRDIKPWEHVARAYPQNDDRMSLTYGLRRKYRVRVLGER